MKKWLKIFTYTFSTLIFILIMFIFITNYLNNPPSNMPEGIFEIKKGENVYSIAQRLKDGSYIKSKFYFITLVRVKNLSTKIKSGHYMINTGESCSKIIEKFVKGESITIKFTIPEGLTSKQIAELLDKLKIVNKDEFLKECSNPEIIKKYNIPFKTLEGFLFPDTYIISEDYSARQIVELMVKRFFSELKKLSFTDYTVNQLKRVVIIASLVEKEAKVDSERPIIAAVFYNRLKRGKRLESCATVQYVLGKTKERLLYRDLKIKSPYNTYLHRGLPPGPISNPGGKSLLAAIHPAKVDYLYFVSKHDGTHYFSKTYSEHLKAIRKYNKFNRVGVQSK